MSKIIQKKTGIKMSQTFIYCDQPQNYKLDIEIKDILGIGRNRVALIGIHSIRVFDYGKGEVEYCIQLGLKVTRVVYSWQMDTFFAIKTGQRQLLSITNSPQPIIESLYSFSANKWGDRQLQWDPWVYLFQKSQYLILVRKFYGQSLVIVFTLKKGLQKHWQFGCSEQTLSKMDDSCYLVIYPQLNKTLRIKLQLFNVQTKQRSKFTIEGNVPPHTCKAVKLYQNKKPEKNGWIRVVLGLNYKVRGSVIMLVDLQQGGQHSVIRERFQYQNPLVDIIGVSLDKNYLKVVEYVLDVNTQQTNTFFIILKIDQKEDKVQCIDRRVLDQQFQLLRYDERQNQLLLYANKLSLEKQNQKDRNCLNKSKLIIYRQVQKKVVWMHLLEQYNQSYGVLGNQILEMIK